MVRLVFRPIPKSEKRFARQHIYEPPPRFPLGFTLLRHSSPSFGSQQVCSHSNLSQKIMVGRWCRLTPSHQSGYLRLWVYNPPTRIHVRLLGPCFKTGRLKVFCPHLYPAVPEGQSRIHALVASAASARLPTFPAVIPPKQPVWTST